MRLHQTLLLLHIAMFTTAVEACSYYSPISIDCPDGIEGRCGMRGVCVECNTSQDCYDSFIHSPNRGPLTSSCTSDDECDVGHVCMDTICTTPRYCSIFGECLSVLHCTVDDGPICPNGSICVNYRCRSACQSDLDCLDGVGRCVDQGYCSYERCSQSGNCPEGFESVKGTLACMGSG